MITIKTEAELDKMRRAGRVVGKFLSAVAKHIRPGVTTGELDKLAEDMIRGEKAIPAFKGYHGFPATICTSVNEEVVHGIPGKRVLKEGDIIGVDVGAIVEGFYADAARTFPVGRIDEEKQKLLDVTRKALRKGIEQASAGNRISDISHAVQSVIEPYELGIVQQYVGHGIGKQLHEDPQVPNFGRPHQGPEIRSGMALAIEPMVNAGSHEVVLAKDGWTVVTKDKRPSAHFENTVLILKKGFEVTTDHG